MDVRITTRRVAVGDATVRRAEQRARKLGKHDPRLQTVSLLFAEDHGKVAVEARAEVPGIPTLVARSEGDSSRTALDRALEKLQRRLHRERKKRTEHHAPPAGAILAE